MRFHPSRHGRYRGLLPWQFKVVIAVTQGKRPGGAQGGGIEADRCSYAWSSVWATFILHLFGRSSRRVDSGVGLLWTRQGGAARGGGQADTKTGSRWARGSEPWLVRWRGLVADGDLSGGKGGRGAGIGGGSGGLGARTRAAGQVLGVKAASGAGPGGLMVMVMVQPGWSFWIWCSSQAWRCSRDWRRV